MRRIEASLVTSPCVLIEHVSEAQGVQDVSGRETEKSFPPGRHAKDAIEGHGLIIQHLWQSRATEVAVIRCRFWTYWMHFHKTASRTSAKWSNAPIINTLGAAETHLDLP